LCSQNPVLAPPPLVFAEGVAITVLALAPPPLVFAEGAAATVLALAPLPLVFAEGAAVTVLATALLPQVFAEGAATAVLALAPPPLVFAEGAAPQSSQLLFCRRCSQSLGCFSCCPACPSVCLFLCAPLSVAGPDGSWLCFDVYEPPKLFHEHLEPEIESHDGNLLS